MKYINIIATLIFVSILLSCTTIRQGEVGVKRTLGKYRDVPYTEGLKIYNPFMSSIEKISTQTENLEVDLSLPSREGVNIQAEISILYSVIPEESPNILRNIGKDFEKNIILPVFRSASADVSSNYYAKDMHTGERLEIESAIKDRMMEIIKSKGIEIEAVLIKSIILPKNLYDAIEEKLRAEQQALRMEFILQQEKLEAERKIVEAKGIRDAQQIISEGLSSQLLQFKSIEAFMELAKSPNTKVIISDGDMPILMPLENK